MKAQVEKREVQLHKSVESLLGTLLHTFVASVELHDEFLLDANC